MAKEKIKISTQEVEELAALVASERYSPAKFSMEGLKNTWSILFNDNENPLIDSYERTSEKFLNSLIRGESKYDISTDNRKLLMEVSAYAPVNRFPAFDYTTDIPEEDLNKYSEDLKIQKENLSESDYKKYSANARKNLLKEIIPQGVSSIIFGGEAPTLDISKRGLQSFKDFQLDELNMQSRLGFKPEVPAYLGPETGYKYNPANNQERYSTKTYESEVYPTETVKTDRLAGFSPDEQSGYLSGPEGLFYNPETEQFLNRQQTYGPPPVLEGYQNDPRLKEILSKSHPIYGSQFNQGGFTGYAQGGNMNIKEQTQNVANQGRYGDSMLLHVNPAEVKGLAQAMPITVNPETGQPEAFLPFLAPLLGSALGTTFLTGLGATAATAGAAATTGISSALAAGLGAGAATYLQTGGSGSKALLSGLTAGFGTNAMNTAASDAAINTATLQGGQTAAMAAQQAAAAAPRAATGPFSAIKDTFMSGPDKSFAFDRGAKSLASGLMSPSGMVAGASLGARSIINSQELYEQQMRELEMEEEERKRAMYANNPEVRLYSASGGMTQFAEGGDTDYDYESNKMQVYAPAKTQYQVNPDFMAGFAPETMYFRPDTINAPSTSTLGGSVPTLGPDTYTGTKGGYDYEGSIDADGNYVAGTAQGVHFAPQTSIDPYAAFTGSAPQGLMQSEYNPYPVQPIEISPIVDDSDYTDIGIGEGGEGGEGSGDYNSDQGYYSDMDLNLAGAMGGFNPADYMGSSGIMNQYIQNKEIQDYLDSLNNPTTDIGDYFTADGPMGKAEGGVTNYVNQGQTEIMSPPVDNFMQDPMTDPLIQEVTMFILGESDNEQVVNEFVNKYGVEAFTALREQILQSLVPNAQTSGLIEGVGNGGMDDDIMGTIGNKEKIAVSQDEFIVPADVVSMLGDGSSDAGSKELYDMMDRVRQKKTGTTKQAPKLANSGGMLPA
jgi:hypothetical protein